MKLRLWSARLALLLGSFVLCIAALEVGLRLFSPVPPSWIAVYAQHPRLPYSLQPEAEWVIDTGVTHWTVRTDAERLRIGPGGSVPASEPHWLVVGDSFAFGHGVDAELGLVGRLEVECGIAIANAGVPGFGPVQYQAMLAEHIDRAGLEGVLVVAYLGNDFHDVFWDKSAETHDGVLGLEPGPMNSIKRNSHVYRLTSRTLHRLGFGGRNANIDLEEDLMDPREWSSHLNGAEAAWTAAYQGMRAYCAKRGIPILALVLPNPASVDEAIRKRITARSSASIGTLDSTLAATNARKWITAAGLVCLDATDVLEGMEGSRFLPFDGHLTAKANAVVAAAIAGDVVLELGKTE